VIAGTGEDVKIDWHGHMDRGLGVSSTLAACEAGADRLHGSALGLGERVGNAPLDLIMVNLKMMGWLDADLSALTEYVEWVARWTGVPVPWNYPVFGRDAFRTGTGVHASAIVKALNMGDQSLVDLVYSSVPASWFGKHQTIEVGPVSGECNVIFWLHQHGEEVTETKVRELCQHAKASDHMLTDDEIRDVLERLERT
jgi:2-isopropylmalate synthase